VNSTKEHIIALLSQGISAAQVAAAAGVSESYISQLRSDPELAALISTQETAKLEKNTAFDNTLERAELMALEKIEKNLPFANMGQAMAAFKILNSARKRADAFGAAQTDQSTNITVNLTLPAAAAARYVVNSSNEIVEVEGQTMITATAKSLDTMLAQRASAQLQQPVVTSLNRAAGMLAQINPLNSLQPVPRPARRVPAALSADVL
jgi:transcriptional regulator with XRE-family HTH domain